MKIDPTLKAICKKHGLNPETDLWDCHGNWIAYHRALERVATKAGIKFDPPQVLEADSKDGIAAICVTGHLGDASVWSIGEASPKNNKNAYCWAMAEKRAVDRVILKLLGLHGYVYSEEEADDFKESKPQASKANSRDVYAKLETGLRASATTIKSLGMYWFRKQDEILTLPKDWQAKLTEEKDRLKAELEKDNG